MSNLEIIKGTQRTYKFVLQDPSGRRAIVHANVDVAGKPRMPAAVLFCAHVIYNVDTKEFYKFAGDTDGLSKEGYSKVLDSFASVLPEADTLIRLLPNRIIVGYIHEASDFYVGLYYSKRGDAGETSIN